MEKLTQKKINRSKVSDKDQVFRDAEVPELYYRICASGGKYYYIQYTSPTTGQRRKKYSIPNASGLPLQDVREAAKRLLVRITGGEDVAEKNQTREVQIKYPTLKEAIDLYEPWVITHRKGGVSTMYSLRSFSNASFWNKTINTITKPDFLEWQEQMIKSAVLTRNTINKKLTMLKAAISRLIENESIPYCEISFPAKLKETDSKVRDRYILPYERKLIMSETVRIARAHPYFLPAIVLSLNTGIRRGTLLELKWEDVNFTDKTLFLKASVMKDSKSHIIPLNSTSLVCLKNWMKITPRSEYIICDNQGKKMTEGKIKKRWVELMKSTKIINLTWHNMRHDFASQLVIAGVDLYVVKELMCHSNITMTERYAHLAPSLKSNAVDKLNNL